MIETIDVKEAAKLLGYKSTSRLCEKARKGLIPGAFKAAVQWRFIVEKLVEYIHSLENANRREAQVDREVTQCHSAKRKIARIGIQGSQSAELECRNQLAVLYDLKLSNTKTGERKKSENRFS